MPSGRRVFLNAFKRPASKPDTGAAPPASLGGIGLIALIALVNTTVYHVPLYGFALENLNGFSVNSVLILITLSVVVFVVTVLIFSLLLLPTQRLLKPLAVVMFVGNAVALYFVQTYQVVLDKTMMSNVLNTDVAEASSFFHPKLLLYLLLLGVLPAWLLLRKRFQPSSRLRLTLFAFTTLLVGLGWIYLASGTWLWIDKNAKRLGGMIMPWSYVINTVRHQASVMASSREQRLLPPASFASDGKAVVVLVIGESARARNFSLYGYERPTNPLLSETDAVALKQTRSCSTYTTASLSCMLSHDNAGTLFTEQYEPLPSYLQRFGVDVIWRSRNWGEPPVKVQSYQRDSALKETCREEGTGCEGDEVLLSGLPERIRASTSDRVFVVLHQKGSHGPDYYSKYPPKFERFKPVCRSVELNQCSHDELLNAYDNTIVYTDYLLQRVIGMLKGFSDRPTLLLYISDHGESLGEHGLYLHGTPYTIAPDVQKEVPFIVWMSPEFKRLKGLADSQLEAQEAHSQDDLFHSILGAFDMRSAVYNARLDIFSGEFTDK